MWREGYVAGGGTRFFVRAVGHGPDVALLLHGWPEDGTAWRRVAPLLTSAGYRVVAPDLKGFGRSEAPHGGYDPETLADEMAQLIRNLHVRKAVVVGHDWGGAVALATAFRHPGRVVKLVIVDSPYRKLDLRRAWHIPLLNLPILPEAAFAHGGEALVRAALRHGSVVSEAFTDDVVAQYAASVGTNPKAWLAYYRTLSRRAVMDRAVRSVRRAVPGLPNPGAPNRLRVPVRVIWGERDPATPLHLAQGVADDLGGDLVTIPGVGHFPHEEDPLRFAQAVVDFVGHAPGVPDDADEADEAVNA
ncbi:MAG TPA: alpha/beta hydrolase [Nitriliruptorales bacterium]